MIVHDFYERLEHSQALSDEPAWVEFYRRIWPHMLAAVRLDADSPMQRAGVDRAIFLPSKQVPFYVDEKKRDKDYGDFLVEEWSNLERKKIGWTLDKTKICDFIAYAVPGRCFLLPFEPLRIACETHLEDWKQRKTVRKWDVQNRTYITRNWSISWDELWRAIRRVSHRKWGEELQLPKPMSVDGQLVFNWGDP